MLGGGLVKKVWCVAKIGLGIFVVMAAAWSLSFFEGFLEMLLGAGLLVGGVALGVFLEKHHSRVFLLLSLLALLMTLLIDVFLLRYFFGGLLVYFACSVALSRKKAVIS